MRHVAVERIERTVEDPKRTRLPVILQRSGRHYSWDSRFFHAFWVVDENMGCKLYGPPITSLHVPYSLF